MINKEKILDNAINELNTWKNIYDSFFNQEKYLDYDELKRFNQINPFPNKERIGITLNIATIKKYINYCNQHKELYYLFQSIKERFNKHNDQIVIKKMGTFRTICNTVEDKQLDDQQIDIIVRENNNQLVIAGAGSGKTTTIVGKIKYLIKTKYATPNEILLLSFTRASAIEMKERVEKEIGSHIDASTFHKLGLEIIKQSSGETVNIYSDDLRKIIKDKIMILINDDDYLKKLIYFISNSRYELKDEFDFQNWHEYEEYLKINPPTTLKKEIVKSYGELIIANFLYINSIEYHYETNYKYNTQTSEYSQYHPDFYLPEYDIYIEYFGIDENGNVAPYFKPRHSENATQEYRDSITWKQNTHKRYNTTMIECYYYEKKKHQLLSNLKRNLYNHNVIFKEKSNAELWQEINKNNYGIIDEISKTFATIINLIKSNNYSLNEFKDLCAHSYQSESNLLILDLIIPIYNLYNQYLNEKNQIDFNDMINLATKYVNEKSYTHNYKYVIVDEYQDISKSKYNLLLALRNQKKYKLFCVGDDWQSIYRFSGSDIGLITNFEKYWGETYISKIENTYRFSNELAVVSSNFIMKNPNQIQKEIKGKKTNKFPIGLINGYTELKSLEFLEERLNDLEQKSTIYFIGRYNFDINIIKDNPNFKVNYNNDIQNQKIIYTKRKDLHITFLTAHRSKGLQADYVVILNNKNAILGFSSKISDLPIINLLLDENDNYPYSEERRLFYVAITRAKKKTFLLTNNNKSIFVR